MININEIKTDKIETDYSLSFKAEIYIHNEEYVDNDKDKGLNPDSNQYAGMETIKAITLESLFIKIKALTGPIERDDHYTDRYIGGEDSSYWDRQTLDRPDGLTSVIETEISTFISYDIYIVSVLEIPINLK